MMCFCPGIKGDFFGGEMVSEMGSRVLTWIEAPKQGNGLVRELQTTTVLEPSLEDRRNKISTFFSHMRVYVGRYLHSNTDITMHFPPILSLPLHLRSPHTPAGQPARPPATDSPPWPSIKPNLQKSRESRPTTNHHHQGKMPCESHLR